MKEKIRNHEKLHKKNWKTKCPTTLKYISSLLRSRCDCLASITGTWMGWFPTPILHHDSIVVLIV